MEILSKLHNEYESVEKLQEGIARVSRKDKEGKKNMVLLMLQDN